MARILKIQAHCSDLFVGVLSQEGKQDRELVGYVPRGIGIGGGDDVVLEIDIDSGKIVNWKVPSEEDLEEHFGEAVDDG